MRAVILLAFVIAVSQLALAATPLEKFLNSTFEPGQQVSVQTLLPDPRFAVVLADGSETYAIDTASGSQVSDRQALLSLLVADAKNRTAFDAKAASAAAFPTDVAAGKKDAEAKCMQYTGTDMHDCIDKQSCTIACFSVPQCSSGPLYSDGFWEAVMDWTTGRKGFDSMLAQYSGGMGAISSDTAVVDQKLSALSGLSALSANLSSNQIFLNRSDAQCVGKNATRCYEYCPKVDYGAIRIEAEKKNLAALKSAILQVNGQAARADALLAAAAKYDAYVASRGRDLAELENRLQNDAKKLNASYASLSAKVSDADVPGMVSGVAALAANISASGDAGRYRSALSLKQPYEQKYNAALDRMAGDLKAYDALFAKIDSLNGKLDSGAWLLGNQTTSDYKASLAAIKTNLTSAGALTPQKMSSASAEIDALADKMADELAAKATSAPQSAQAAAGVKLPCLPGFILLGTLCLVLGMSKKDLSRKHANLKVKIAELEQKARMDPIGKHPEIHEELSKKTLADLNAGRGLTQDNLTAICDLFKASLEEASGRKIQDDFYGEGGGARPFGIWEPFGQDFTIELRFNLDEKSVKLVSNGRGGLLCEESMEKLASVLAFANELVLNHEKIDALLLSSPPRHPVYTIDEDLVQSRGPEKRSV